VAAGARCANGRRRQDAGTGGPPRPATEFTAANRKTSRFPLLRKPVQTFARFLKLSSDDYVFLRQCAIVPENGDKTSFDPHAAIFTAWRQPESQLLFLQSRCESKPESFSFTCIIAAVHAP
jgi:hypothetical protein